LGKRMGDLGQVAEKQEEGGQERGGDSGRGGRRLSVESITFEEISENGNRKSKWRQKIISKYSKRSNRGMSRQTK